MSGIVGATSFLTAVGRGHAPDPSSLRWFPAVGAALGATLGLIWLGAAHLWPAPVAAAVVVAADLALTGFLHVDGLVDSADGLLPHLTRERRLEVMTEPCVGAFGVASAATVVLLRWTALAAVVPDARLLAAVWCLSRTIMVGTTLTTPYARVRGLASGFLVPEGERSGTVAALVSGAAVAVALAAWWRPGPGVAVVAAGTVAALAVIGLARRRLGGFTGDVLGAAGVISETVALLAAAPRW